MPRRCKSSSPSSSPALARKIRPNRRSITGLVPSLKTNRLIPHESTLERDAIILYEGDPRVRRVTAQPVLIKDGAVRYTPDLLIERDSDSEFVEVKYSADLKEQWAEIRARLSAGAKYANARGFGFSIDTEEKIRSHRLANLKRLWRYRRVDVPTHERIAIRALVAEHGPQTALEIVRRLSGSVEEQPALLTSVWALLTDGSLVADLDFAPLNNSTPLRLS